MNTEGSRSRGMGRTGAVRERRASSKAVDSAESEAIMKEYEEKQTVDKKKVKKVDKKTEEIIESKKKNSDEESSQPLNCDPKEESILLDDESE